MGVIISYGVRSYICDPPEGFVNSSNEEINTNNQASKKLTLLDLLINPFSYFLKR
jgi:predicted peroxiredoxin